MVEMPQIQSSARWRSKPEWRAFLELGFRPLYVAGCLWAAVSVALWVFAPQLIGGPLYGAAWHAHEMLWGFIATVAVGFLLTASSNWTGINPLRGPPLAALCTLWLLARGAFLVPAAAAFWLAAVCEIGFFAWAAAALGKAICTARSRRNYGVPVLLLGLGTADALYLLASLQGDYPLMLQRFNTGLICMAVISLLVARRVIPFFATRVLADLRLPLHALSGQWQLGAGVLAILFSLLQIPLVMALALAVAGAIALVQVVTWKPWAVRHEPLLWILYIGYAALGAGLLVCAAYAGGWITRAAWPAHAIGVAGLSVLLIGMVTRTALGHLGRPLRADRYILAAYGLVIAAAVLRLMALLPTAFALAALHASATTWILAFALYLWRFFPWMIRPRCNPDRLVPTADRPADPAQRTRLPSRVAP